MKSTKEKCTQEKNKNIHSQSYKEIDLTCVTINDRGRILCLK